MCKRLFAVAGNPVLHSLSPLIFNSYFKKNGIDACYIRILAKNGAEALDAAEKSGFSGINVTAPFKEEMFGLMDETDKAVADIGAVNTVLFKNGKKAGFNTDWLGVQDSFFMSGTDISGKQVLIAGAGGAARAAVYAMIQKKALVTIVNRSEKKGIGLAEKYGARFAPLSVLPELMKNHKIIISAVSGGVNPFPEGSFSPEHTVLDADYHQKTVGKAAAKSGAKIISGLQWLIFQADHSLKLFTGLSGLEMPERVTEMKSNIALTGFMGCGKSSTARELAKILNKPLFDTDEFIERNEEMTISEIFAQKGEIYFRELEGKAVEKACSLKNHIISFGGGAVLSEKNRRNIRSQCLVFWLFADAETAVRRLGVNILSRPLFHDVLNPVKTAETLLKRRIKYYAECADVMINTEKVTPFETAEMIVEEIDKTRIS